MKYCTRMQLTIRTVFLTVHAHILNLELWARTFAAVHAELQHDQSQNDGALAHTRGEFSRPHLSCCVVILYRCVKRHASYVR